MHYTGGSGFFKIVFEDRDEVLVVRARRLSDAVDFIDSDVEIEAIW